MTKKPFSMRFDPHLVALADALAKERGIDRTAVFSLAVLAYVSHPKRAPSEVGEKIVDAVKPKAKPKAKPVDEFGDAPAVNVQKLDIAEWGSNRRAPGLRRASKA